MARNPAIFTTRIRGANPIVVRNPADARHGGANSIVARNPAIVFLASFSTTVVVVLVVVCAISIHLVRGEPNSRSQIRYLYLFKSLRKHRSDANDPGCVHVCCSDRPQVALHDHRTCAHTVLLTLLGQSHVSTGTRQGSSILS